jgi:hypothetical protein
VVILGGDCAGNASLSLSSSKRSSASGDDPAKLWNLYLLLVRVEEAFKNLKGDLAIRPGAAYPVARARWRRYFAFSLAFRLLARIVLLDLAVFITGLRS